MRLLLSASRLRLVAQLQVHPTCQRRPPLGAALDEEVERLGADDDNLQLYCALSLEALGDLEAACLRLETYIERGRRERGHRRQRRPS